MNPGGWLSSRMIDIPMEKDHMDVMRGKGFLPEIESRCRRVKDLNTRLGIYRHARDPKSDWVIKNPQRSERQVQKYIK